jgi:hypothetical protein
MPHCTFAAHHDHSATMNRGTLKKSAEALERQLIQETMEENLNQQTKASDL